MPERIAVPGRAQTDPRILRPVARPVDTFVSPPQATAAQQIADSLSSLVPSLSRFAGVLGEQKGAKERQAGQARAREMIESGKTFAEAVRTGQIRPDQNPWFRVGAFETFGRVEGLKYMGDLLESIQSSGLGDSAESLEEIDAYEQAFRQQFVASKFGEKMDPFMANAFGTTVDGQWAGLRNEFARQVGERLVKRNSEGFHSEIYEIAQRFRGTDLSPSERAAEIRIAQERQVVTGGMTLAEVNRLTVSAIARAAIATRDMELLQIIHEIPTDPKSKGYLGGTSYGAEAIENAELAIARAVDADATRENRLSERRRDEAIRTVSGAMVDAVVSNPGVDITPFIEEIREVDPSYIPVLTNIRDNIADGRYRDNPDVAKDLTIGIMTAGPGEEGYTTLRDLDEAFGAQQLSLSTYRSLRDDIIKRDEEGGSGTYRKNPYVTSIRAEAYRAFTSEFIWDTEFNRYNAQQAADEAAFQMISWLRANPNATAEETQLAQTNIRNAVVLQRIQTRNRLESSSGEPVPAKVPAGRAYVADPVVSGAMIRELDELEAGRRNSFTVSTLETLRMNNVDTTDLKAVRKFLREQQDWTTKLTTPKP